MINTIRKLSFIVLLMAPATYSIAESLDECQQLADNNYPLIKQYDLVNQTSQFTVQNLKRGWLPQLTFSAQATLQSDVVALPDGLQNMMKLQGMDIKGLKKDQYKIALDLQQTIYDGGSIKAQQNVATRQSEVQTAQMNVELYAVRDRVLNLYYGILLNQERTKQIDATIKLLNTNLERINNRVQGGVAMKCDANALRAEVLSAEQQKTDLEASIVTLKEMLKVFCGKEVTPEQSELDKVTEASIGSTDQRPEIKLINKQSELISAQESLLNVSTRPRLFFFAQGYYGYPGLNMYDDMLSHDWSLNGILGLKLQWNLSNFYTKSADKQKLQLQKDQLQVQRETFNFNSQLQQTQEQLLTIRCQKIMVQDDEIIQLRQSVREASEAKLEEGIIDSNVLLQDITREQQARIAKTQHQIELLQHLAELKYLQGNE